MSKGLNEIWKCKSSIYIKYLSFFHNSDTRDKRSIFFISRRKLVLGVSNSIIIVISFLLLSSALFANDKFNPISDVNESEQLLTDTISNFPYLQSFEGIHGWTVAGQNASWEIGIPANSLINSASDGQKAWVTGLSSNYHSYEKSWVQSPVFDFSNLVAPGITFDILYETEEFEDGACFEYSLNGGLTWLHVGQNGDVGNWYNSYFVANLFMTNSLHGWTGNPYNTWHQSSHDLSFLAGQPSVKFRFYFGASQNLNMYEGFAFDNIVISDIQAVDVGINVLLFPLNDCVFGSQENIKLQIKNFGYNTVGGFTMSFQHNSGTLISEYVADSIHPDSVYNYEFSSTVNLSSAGINSIFVSVDLNGDQAAYNDTMTVTLNLIPPANLPYYENFESGVLPPGWSLSQEAGSNGWLVGTNLGSTYFDIPPHTFYAASNDDTCYCDMSNDMLITPAFDFSSYSSVTLQYDAYISGLFGSSGKILATTDCGLSWNMVQYVLADTFYWHTYSVNLDVYAGYPSVKLAFHHDDSGVWAAGFAVDNVNVSGILAGITQFVPLHAGWGLMSSYIDPLIPSIDSVFSEVYGNLIILKNGDGNIYWPAYNLNVIGDHIIGDGYQYNINISDTLPIYGTPVVPELEPISLTVGWNLIGYLRNIAGDASVIMSSISASVKLMKDENGSVYWPEYNLNGIGLMYPGKGYSINMIYPAVFSYPPN